MRLFLRETWELFWWAMFCPSKLQQRMNEWCPQKERDGSRRNTYSLDILLWRAKFRFIAQYLLLLVCLSLPIIVAIAINGQRLDWLQLVSLLVTAYGISVWFLSMGLAFPWFWWIVYLYQPNIWQQVWQKIIKLLPSLPQISLGIVAGALVLGITLELMQWLLNRERLLQARNVTVVGGILSAALGGWIATQNLMFVLTIVGAVGWILLVNRNDIELRFRDSADNTFAIAIFVVALVAFVVSASVAFALAGLVALALAGLVAFVVALVVTAVLIGVMRAMVAFVIGVVVATFVATFMAVVVAAVVATVVAGGSTLPLTPFIWFTGLIAFSLVQAEKSLIGPITAIILVSLGFEHLGWQSLLIIPVILATYYRLIPDYLTLVPISLCALLSKHWRPHTLQLLSLLPPYSSELLWFALPYHDRLLVTAFRENATEALKTFQQMQVLTLPGFTITTQKALPQIVADQLSTVTTIPELLTTATPDHPILSRLIAPFYSLETAEETPLPPVGLQILPKLQTTVRDIQAVLENKNAALRERGLERVMNNLVELEVQLPFLGFKAQDIQHWHPVLERWQRVIKTELEQQQIQSQSELLNPFLYGNPVRLNQKDLFKGRQSLADRILRLILDRNRPTLVLHGPRRCGKTSFLYNLPRLFPSDIVPIFLDMQSAAITTSEGDFCYGLVRAISKDSRIQGLSFPPIPSRHDFQTKPYTTLEDWLDQALPQLGERRLLLNLDEFEKMGTAIIEGRITLHLLDHLRHLIQHYEQLGFLFSGVQTLEELGPHWSSYFISVVPLEMLYLEPQEAEELLLYPDPEFALKYDVGIVEEVLRLTRCQPYLLQLLGAAMVTQANLHRTTLVTPELLELAIIEALTLGEPYFTNLWTEFTGTNTDEVATGQQLLLDVAQGKRAISGGKSLERLLRYHILEEINGGYDFEVPLVKLWVKTRAIAYK